MLHVRAFGPLRVERDGHALEPPSSRRAWGLLAYLALHPGAHARGELAARFWPDVLDASARQSLRSAVWALRRALAPDGGRVLASRDEIELARDDLSVDALEFRRLLGEQRLEEAAALATGELLAGFDDEWALQERQAHRERLGEALETLAAAAEAAGDGAGAARWTRRQAALDPLDEAAHRRLMSRLAAAGDRSGALTVYRQHRERLRRELRLLPSPETRALADELRREEAPAAPAPAVAPAVRRLPLVGRNGELDALVAAWTSARSGSGGVVLLSGEPGIGKSRLAVELLAQAARDGARTAACAALDLGGAPALGLWAELIADLAAGLEPPPLDAAWPADLAALAPGLEAAFGRERTLRTATSPDLERARLHSAVVELVTWASRRQPLVLLLEDVHTSDSASLELAAYVGRRATRLPLLILLTRRLLPSSAAADALEYALQSGGALLSELELGPLPDDAVAQLVGEVAPLPAGDVTRIVEAAEGNPLLAVESARALAAGRSDPPPTLRAAVRAALAPVPPEPRLLAEFAAAAGRPLALAELERLPVAAPAETATLALQTGLLVADEGRIGYRHAVLREVVYADLPDPRRVWLHERLAAALAPDEELTRAAEVARHLRLAGHDDQAATQLVAAAAQARAVAALTEAAQFLREADELAPDDGRLLLELAEVEAWRGRMEASEAAFARALESLDGDAESVAEAWARCAEWWSGPLCAPRQVLEAARTALAVLDRDGLESPELRRRALASAAWAEAIAGDPDAADELLAQIEKLSPAEDRNDLLVHGIEHARALALIRRGRFEESYEPARASGDAAVRAGRSDLSYASFANAACAASCTGDFERALALVDQGLATTRDSGIAAFLPHYHAARAYVLLRLGRGGEARAASDTQIELADRLDLPELRALADHDAGMVALALGEHERAAELLGRALEHDVQASRPLARLARAEALIGLGRCGEAEQELRETAFEPVGPSDLPDTLVPRLTRLQGLLAAARGDESLAARRLREAADGWRRRLDRSARGDSYAATLADLGRPPVAGLVEPERELERVDAEPRLLEQARV